MDLMLQILELQHAVLLHVENASPDGDIAALNNAARSLLDQVWSRGSLLGRETSHES